MIEILYVLLAVSIFFVFFFLLRYIKKEGWIRRTVKQMSHQFQEHSRIRQKEMYKTPGEEQRGMLKIERLLYGSGLKKAVPFLSPELLIMLMTVTAGSGFLLMSVLQAELPVKILSLLCGPVLLYMILHIGCLLNYNRIEKDLIVFLNLLDSFSITASEITFILYKTSHFLEPPLRDLLEDCYFETQISGDASGALYHLMEKSQHPKFREIIRNLEVCSRYDADYAGIVQSCRKNIQDYLAYRKKRKAIINIAKIEMFILLAIVLILSQLIGVLMEINIWNIIFLTFTGRCIFGSMMLVLAWFYYRIVVFDKG